MHPAWWGSSLVGSISVCEACCFQLTAPSTASACSITFSKECQYRTGQTSPRHWLVFALVLLVQACLSVTGAAGESLERNTLSCAEELDIKADTTVLRDLPAFLDGLFAAQLAAYEIPAAVVAVVKDGRLHFDSGYGYADLQRTTPVQPDTTLFRTGSVSKLFTWTAVMQLVEQGRLDLQADVNRYLEDIQIPATFPEPVTMAHLLTHTAGFEARSFGTYARTAPALVPLGEFLADTLPHRVFAPGEVSAYSNYGAALAGYLVERISGLPFERYVEEHILAPLCMRRSSFRQPLPAELAADLATGYDTALEPGDFEWKLTAPAGALSATATDIARFMIAHLHNGRWGRRRILQEPTADQMHRRQFANHPAVSGMTYGFQELHINGQRIIWHGGDTLYFSTGLFLLPEQNLGLYVAYNRGGVSQARLDLLQAIVNRYYPVVQSPDPPPLLDFQQRASRYTGGYRSTRSNRTTLEKVRKLFVPVRVQTTPTGVLHITGLKGVVDGHWIEVAPLVFRNLESAENLAFRADDKGRVTHLFEGNLPFAGYVRLPWYGVPEFHQVLLGACALIFLSALVGWAPGVWRDRSLPGIGASHQRLVRLAVGSMSLLSLVFLAGMALVMIHVRDLLFGISLLLRTLLVLPLLCAALAAATLVLAMLGWWRGYWTVWQRVRYTLIAFAGLGFIWSLYYWNLLGLRF